MSDQPPARLQPTASQPSAGRSAALVLLGLAAVLAVTAVGYLTLALWDHPTSAAVCGHTDTSLGECLLASQLSRSQNREIWAWGLSLGAGALTAALSAAVVGGTALLRRR